MNPNRLRSTGASPALRVCVATIFTLLLACGEPGQAPGPENVEGEASEIAGMPLPSALPGQKPGRRVAFSEGCSSTDCHAEFGRETVVHAPLREDRCQLCHLPDEGDHRFPVIPAVDESCRDCHATGHAALYPHGGVSELSCLDCHLPHGGGTGLLRSTAIRALCAHCHDMGLGRYEHLPYAKDDCFLCHTRHGADNAAQRVPVLARSTCASCHERQSAGFSSDAASGHGQLREACLTCHDAHVSDAPNLLRLPSKEGCTICHEGIGQKARQAGHPHGALQIGKECLNCHDPHDSRRPHMLREEQGLVCLGCHDKEILTKRGKRVRRIALAVGESDFSHGPVREGDCSTCHEVHGSQQAGLLRRAPEGLAETVDAKSFSLCFACHDRNLVEEEVTTTSTQFRNGDQNLHYLHIKEGKRGRPCTECHQVHGGSLPRHMAKSVRFQGSDYRMTIGFQLRDKGGTCRPGCHEELPYERFTTKRLDLQKKRLKENPEDLRKRGVRRK